MFIDEIRSDFTQLQSDIADGPILPTVTAEEVRTYLESRYDFHQTLPLEEVVSDVEKMLRTWQVQVTHPRYFGLFNPRVTLASVVANTLVAMYNPQLANWRTSPAANEDRTAHAGLLHSGGACARRISGIAAQASNRVDVRSASGQYSCGARVYHEFSNDRKRHSLGGDEMNRLSIGIEHRDDIIAVLKQALDATTLVATKGDPDARFV